MRLAPVPEAFLGQGDAGQISRIIQKITDWVDAFDAIEQHDCFGGRVPRLRAQRDHPLVVLLPDSDDGADLNEQFSIAVITDGELVSR